MSKFRTSGMAAIVIPAAAFAGSLIGIITDAIIKV